MPRVVVLSLALVASCGRVGFEAGTTDAADAQVDAPPRNCFDRWRTGAPPLTAPILLLDDGNTENDPSLTPDGLRVYYTTDRDGPSRLYITERATVDGNYHEAGIASDFPQLARGNIHFVDDLTVYATDVIDASNDDIVEYRRSSTSESFAARPDARITALSTLATELDVFVTADALSLYFTRFIGAGDFDIYRSTRPSTAEPGWSTPVAIHNLAAVGVAELDPYVTPDELTMLYSTLTPSPQQEYVTTRASTADDFGPGVLLDLGDTSAFNHDAVLSPDGCEVYFSSDRLGNSSLFLAQVLP